MEARDKQAVETFYNTLSEKISKARDYFKRPLTLAEKILFSHITSFPSEAPVRGKTTLNFKPDRVAMQDATAQMAILQYMTAGLDTVAVPSTVHCDHLIRAEVGAGKDLLKAFDENEEVYEFLRSSCERYGIGFWKAGSGIIHQVVLEQYGFPGGMMIGTDSHTPNAGGLGMIAIGVGGADAVDVMVGQPWGLLNPKLVGIKLTGKLSGWSSAKDVILKVAGMLTVKGGTSKIIEYFGEGAESISCTGKATITNMGAELGATTSLFGYDKKMGNYLNVTEREWVTKLADKNKEHLCSDKEVHANPKDYYDEFYEINLSELKPSWVGPHTPDLYRNASEMKDAVQKEGYPDEIRFSLIGSCTNSSYEDISRAASVAAQAKAHGLKVPAPFMVTPGSDQVFQTIKRDGYMDVLNEVGATVLANACGPCIGQWSRSDIKKGEKNTIITSYNRNFRKRNDGNEETLAFIGSPELVTAVAFSGKLSFNPEKDTLKDSSGKDFKFSEPTGEELPPKGYVLSKEGYIAPKENLEERKKIKVLISPTSDRLDYLPVFDPWDGKDMQDMLVLMKAKGKCTTDHISQAGPWLKYRGHLPKISDNMFLGAENAFTGESGKGTDLLSGEKSVLYPEIAKRYKAAGKPWVVFGEENYGEGSSREHAALSPRFLGAKAIIVKSFARIHETNLKKQGVLPLTFVNPDDFNHIEEDSKVSIVGLTTLAPGSKITLKVTTKSGVKEIPVSHTMTDEQILWFKAGSALNIIRPK